MAEVKTKPTKVSVASYLAGLPDENRRADAKTIIKMMQDATGEKPKMWGPSMIGFGIHHYVYESGRRRLAAGLLRAAQSSNGTLWAHRERVRAAPGQTGQTHQERQLRPH